MHAQLAMSQTWFRIAQMDLTVNAQFITRRRICIYVSTDQLYDKAEVGTNFNAQGQRKRSSVSKKTLSQMSMHTHTHTHAHAHARTH
jgi:hypothetical protein